jgi:hypothetical protein
MDRRGITVRNICVSCDESAAISTACGSSVRSFLQLNNVAGEAFQSSSW